MDSTLWYLIAFCGIIMLSFALWTLKFLFPRFRNKFVRVFKHPLLLNRGRFWDSITRLEACFVTFFIGLNLFVIFSPFESPDWRRIERRAAFASGINLIPVCLGSRMGPMMEAFNIHYSTYRLMHHWIGRMAIVDGLIHAAIVLSLKPRSGTLVISGWATFGAVLGTLVSSFFVIRAFLSRWFLISHRIITLSVLGALLWHVLMQPALGSQLVACASIFIWSTFTVYRCYRIFRHPLSGEIVDVCRGAGLAKIEVILRRPTWVGPGAYFNIFFPGEVAPYALLRSFSCVAFWHPPDENDPCQKLTNISFLLSSRGKHSVAISNLEKGQKILLEGPFGKNHKLHRYENIVLAAEGVGIAAVLPLALDLAERKRHDNIIRRKIQNISSQLEELRKQIAQGQTTAAMQENRELLLAERGSLLRQPMFRDSTKKIDIFWSMRDNMEMDVVQDQLRALQRLDPENKLIVFWCGYPSQKNGAEPFDSSHFWLCIEPSATAQSFEARLFSKIKEERRNAHGAMIVTTCGGMGFTKRTRACVISSVDGKAIEFVETEFRPQM